MLRNGIWGKRRHANVPHRIKGAKLCLGAAPDSVLQQLVPPLQCHRFHLPWLFQRVGWVREALKEVHTDRWRCRCRAAPEG